MEVLSVKMIGKYDYIKTKNYVEEELFNLKILGTRLMCLLPPDAGRQINLLDKVSENMEIYYMKAIVQNVKNIYVRNVWNWENILTIWKYIL